MDWLESIGAHWIWLTLGLVLATLEMLVPGVYLIWLALAAIATGILTALFDIPLSMQIVDFVFLSLIAAYSARRFFRESPDDSADPLMNDRGGRMVGQTAIVSTAIENGTGRVKYGDGEWIARGPEMAAGARVRIVGSEGAVLLVEPVNLIES